MKAKRAIGLATRAFILCLILVWSGLPILVIFISAFKDPITIFESPPKLIFYPTVKNFVVLVKEFPEFFSSLWNSFVVTAGASLLSVSVTFVAGYAFSRHRGRYFTISAFSMLAIRMLPPIVATIALFPIINILKLQDTHYVLIIIYSAFFISMGTWIMKCFIDMIPVELEESASIDGATIFQTMRHIVLPLSLHGMMAVAIFVIIFSWKEYLWASIFTTSRAITAPIVIAHMLDSVVGAQWGALFASTLIQYIPMLIFILYAQKFMITGMIVGAVKE